MTPPRGRPRKPTRDLPAHIDASKLPAGIYWDAPRQRWYVKDPRPAGGSSTKRVAGADAQLSDLHAIVESRQGVDRRTLDWLCGEFAASDQHRALAKATRTDYAYSCGVLCGFRLRTGQRLGELHAARLARPMMQRVIDAIARGDGARPTPSKAQHVRRYGSRLWEWAANRGHVPATNPFAGLDAPAERKQRRLPDAPVLTAVIEFARERAGLGAGNKGAVPPYLWAAAEIAYLCRLRGIEVATLTDANAGPTGVLTNRRKGSRDNTVSWSPRLRAAWDALTAYRAERVAAKRRPVPLRAADRALIVAQDGAPIAKSSIDTAWQRLMALAIEEGVITADQRFGLHDLKRRGITDTPGTAAEKQRASGHRSEAMLAVYDHEKPLVDPAGAPEFSPEFSPRNEKGPAGEG